MMKTSINNELAILSDFEALIQRVRASSLTSADRKLVTDLIKGSTLYMVVSLNENIPTIKDDDFLKNEG